MYFVLKSLKFLILFTLFRSTCFGHHCVRHQELLSCTCSLWSCVVLGSLCPPVLLCCNCSYTPIPVTLHRPAYEDGTDRVLKRRRLALGHQGDTQKKTHYTKYI